MASVEQRDLVPDEMILSTIFSAAPCATPSSCKILSNTFGTCTFCIRLHVVPFPSSPKDLLVRLETSADHLAAVASLQRLAHDQLPDLVPSVLDVGIEITADGKRVGYSVTPYFTGTITFEDVWETLSPTDQLELVDSVVSAVEKLQKLDRNSDASIGGPKLGYFSNVELFLGRNLQATSPNRTLSGTDEGTVLESAFEDIGRVEYTRADLDDLQRHIVFCHNDLEPRNILVRKSSPAENESPRYELAAIIDWEMAGFYPFAYEYGVKDTVLGSSNLYFSWYFLFKERTSHLLPRAGCHTKLIKALRIIDDSKKRSITRNVGVQVQAKWLEREYVERSSDLRKGWVRKAGARGPGPFTKDDQARLELEVLRELGYV